MFAAGFTSISDELTIRPQPNPHVLPLLSSYVAWASTEASIPILISTPSISIARRRVSSRAPGECQPESHGCGAGTEVLCAPGAGEATGAASVPGCRGHA